MSVVSGPPALSLGAWFPREPGSSLSFSHKGEGVGGREAGATPTAPSFQTGALGPTSSVPSVPVGARPTSLSVEPSLCVKCRTGRDLAHGVRTRTHTCHPGPVATLVQRVGVHELRLHPTVTGLVSRRCSEGAHLRPRWADGTSIRDKLEVWLPLTGPCRRAGVPRTDAPIN